MTYRRLVDDAITRLLQTSERIDPSNLAAELGWPIIVTTLSARSGGLQAALVPTEAGFSIVVDRYPCPGLQEQLDPQDLRALRVAHEIGHSFFYSYGERPPLRLSFKVTPEGEEDLCNQFAANLVARPDLPYERALLLLR